MDKPFGQTVNQTRDTPSPHSVAGMQLRNLSITRHKKQGGN